MLTLAVAARVFQNQGNGSIVGDEYIGNHPTLRRQLYRYAPYQSYQSKAAERFTLVDIE